MKKAIFATWSIALALTLVSLGSAAKAQDTAVVLDPVECLYALEDLDIQFRSNMQSSCFGVTARHCLGQTDPNQCFIDVNLLMRSHFEQVKSQLPQTIDGDGLTPRRYERAVARFAGYLSGPEECADFLEVSVDTKAEFCAFTHLFAGTVELIYFASLYRTSLSE